MAMMDDALSLAQAICWDEGYGYRLGGHAASYSDGVDCGGLVFHCLHAAGYNVSDTSPGTSNMPSILRGIGFTEIAYDSSYVPQHGDIVVMNHYETGHNHGHTFFYCEDIRHYSDYTANSSAETSTGPCKVEASDYREHYGEGDSQKNGTGAYWEVWCHSYYNFVQPYDPDEHTGYHDSDVTIYRDPSYTPGGGNAIAALLMALVGGAAVFTGGHSRRRLR